MSGKKTDSIMLVENLREVDILDDFWILCQECRENYYYVKSLKEILSIVVVLNKSDVDVKKKLDNYHQQLQSLIFEFDKLESQLGVEKELNCLSHPVVKCPSPNEMNIDVFNVLKQYIELKSKMEKSQLEIITYLMNLEDHNLEIITEKFPELKHQHMLVMLECLIETSFNHSVDEDKIVNYRFNCKNKIFAKELEKEGVKLPLKLSVRDHSFEVDKARKKYQIFRKKGLEIVGLISQLEEQKYLKEISKNQERYSRQVTILTYIITVLTVLTVITGGISTYYTITDHMKKDNEHAVQIQDNNKKISNSTNTHPLNEPKKTE